METAALRKEPDAPQGIIARFIDDKHLLGLNISDHVQEINIKGQTKNILTGNSYSNQFTLKAYEPKFIEIR